MIVEWSNGHVTNFPSKFLHNFLSKRTLEADLWESTHWDYPTLQNSLWSRDYAKKLQKDKYVVPPIDYEYIMKEEKGSYPNILTSRAVGMDMAIT